MRIWVGVGFSSIKPARLHSTQFQTIFWPLVQFRRLLARHASGHPDYMVLRSRQDFSESVTFLVGAGRAGFRGGFDPAQAVPNTSIRADITRFVRRCMDEPRRQRQAPRR